MRTYYIFQSEKTPQLQGFTEEPQGRHLPSGEGPWKAVRRIEPDEEWDVDTSRAVVAAGILENGYYLSGPIERPRSPHPEIESDRVEGTPVFNRDNERIGTVKRLFIEKISGRVTKVDVTFGGFLGIGVHHRTIPWEKLEYDPDLEGYRTDITGA
ncbi:PRC-barrel domain-containing protein [Microvirga makkahensis]|uniref:PRC-barrel domain containing protein n=1 Tax=Microvirga makkahensis TaxID=1128670 RepID=A0A7X3MTM3_9HYPH|nr:PRC-barrel domain-containing protein [Microvirga makkahensis]MXQ12984.1 PRC-barrel domain containing protein [Microvirga makkahensis]